jgi:hypothetical protein
MTQRQGNIFFVSLAAFLFAISVWLHFYKIGEIPNGFYCDECSIGVNARSILKTGMDEHGVRFPFFFKCFGNYHEPVMVYSIAALGFFFDISKAVVRAPGAVFHILASVAFFFLARRYCREKYIALAAAFVFSALPWVFPLSRITMSGYTPMLLGIICGWLFMMRAFGRRSYTAAVLSAFFWVFAMWSHNCGRPVTATLLVILTLSLNKALIKRWKVFLVFCAGLGLCAAPMAFYFITDPVSLTGRFSQISVFKPGLSAADAARLIAENWLGYFSPGFLFFSGDANLRHHTGYGGQLYIFTLPFALLGIAALAKAALKNPWARFALGGLLFYPVAAALTTDHWHATRSVNGSVFWCVAAAAGAGAAFHFLKKRRRGAAVFRCAAALLGLLNIALYTHDYFTDYSLTSREFFRAPLTEALDQSFRILGKGEILHADKLCFLSEGMTDDFKPVMYSYFLFFGKLDPVKFHREGLPMVRVAAGPEDVTEPGVFIRVNPVLGLDALGGPVLGENKPPPPGAELLAKIPATVPSVLVRGGEFFLWRGGEPEPPQSLVATPPGAAVFYEIYRTAPAVRAGAPPEK